MKKHDGLINLLKNLVKKSFKLMLTMFLTILLFELAYRYQWFDSYHTEWVYFNDKLERKSSNYLIFGDSFSANKNSWINLWGEKHLQSTFYNSSIPGVGAETFRLIQENRINEVKPDKIIIQLYVGNDLYDIRKPVNWRMISWRRNLFWTFSNRFRSLNFLNYRMGQINLDAVNEFDPKKMIGFQPNLYSKRTKLFIHSNANYPENHISISKSLDEDFDQLITYLDEMKAATPKNCSLYILVIPHCAEVSNYYKGNYKKLGSVFNSSSITGNVWAERLKNKGYTTINPLEIFRSNDSDTSRIYFDNDPHLTTFGQEKLSQFVDDFFDNDLEKD